MHSVSTSLVSRLYGRQVSAQITLARFYRWRSFRRTFHSKLVEARDAAENPKAREALSKLIGYHESRRRSPERLWSDAFFVVGSNQNLVDPEPHEKGIAEAHVAVLLATLETLDG